MDVVSTVNIVYNPVVYVDIINHPYPPINARLVSTLFVKAAHGRKCIMSLSFCHLQTRISACVSAKGYLLFSPFHVQTQQCSYERKINWYQQPLTEVI